MGDPLQDGWVPLDGEEQKRKSSAKYWIGLLIFLAASYAVKNIHDNAARKKANEMGPKMVQSIYDLSPEDLAHFANLLNKVDKISQKYLTAAECEDYLLVCGKQLQGAMTQEEFNREIAYYKKVRARATKSEVDTIDEFERLARRLAGIKE